MVEPRPGVKTLTSLHSGQLGNSWTLRLDLSTYMNLRNLHSRRLWVDNFLNIDWQKIAALDKNHNPLGRYMLEVFLRCILPDTLCIRNLFLWWRTYNSACISSVQPSFLHPDIVLSLMEFSALQHFAINLQSTVILDLLQRSYCSLKILELELITEELDEDPELDYKLHLFPFPTEIPSLENLALMPCSFNSVDRLFAWLSKLRLIKKQPESSSIWYRSNTSTRRRSIWLRG